MVGEYQHPRAPQTRKSLVWSVAETPLRVCVVSVTLTCLPPSVCGTSEVFLGEKREQCTISCVRARTRACGASRAHAINGDGYTKLFQEKNAACGAANRSCSALKRATMLKIEGKGRIKGNNFSGGWRANNGFPAPPKHRAGCFGVSSILRQEFAGVSITLTCPPPKGRSVRAVDGGRGSVFLLALSRCVRACAVLLAHMPYVVVDTRSFSQEKAAASHVVAV